jgi:F-type H+-transporting ATPase subunit delta
MSQDASIGGRYARALLLLTQQQVAKSREPLVPVLERTLAELDSLAVLTAPGSPLGNFLIDPQISPADRRKVLERGLKGRAMPSVQVFADLLLRKHRIGITRAVAREFKAIVERAKGLERATVVSAVPLSEAEIRRLHGELERTTGKKIVLERQLDPTLLGGAYVRIGDHVVDRSVKAMLEAIAHQLYEVHVSP